MSRHKIEESKDKREGEPLQPITIQRSPEPGAPSPNDLQSSYGNAAIAQSLTQGEGDVATPKAATPPLNLIVDDSAQTLEPGQMKKNDFLSQLRGSMSKVADEVLSGTLTSVGTSIYIDQWLSKYVGQSGQQIEQEARKYAPGAKAASDYIGAITRRVRQELTTWMQTGENSGGAEGADSTGGSIIGDAVSAIGGIFFKERNGGARRDDDPRAVQSRLGGGQALDGGVRSKMESAFGESFSEVEVHADTKGAGMSSDLNARAFTVGDHIAFGAGEYQPGTLIGDALIAHELAHVMQQRGGKATEFPAQKGMAGYGALEEDADRAAVGAVVSTWGGAKKGLANISKNALPSLKSGLRLQRCKTKEQKEKRLAGLQFDFMEKKRKDKEDKARKDAEEAAKKRGEVNPKVEVKVKMEDVTADDMKESKFVRSSTDPWLKDIDDAARKNYTDVRAPGAWNKVMTSIKGTEIEQIMKGKTYKFAPEVSLENNYYAWQDGTVLNFGMDFIHNVEAPGGANNVWPILVHEMGGHFEYGETYAEGIMKIVLDLMPEAERKELTTNEKKRDEFFLTYTYPETEIYSALRQRRYDKPETGPAPHHSGMDPDTNIEIRLTQLQKVSHPEVAKAILIHLKGRVHASPDILERDKKYFDAQVAAKFGI